MVTTRDQYLPIVLEPTDTIDRNTAGITTARLVWANAQASFVIDFEDPRAGALGTRILEHPTVERAMAALVDAGWIPQHTDRDAIYHFDDHLRATVGHHEFVATTTETGDRRLFLAGPNQQVSVEIQPARSEPEFGWSWGTDQPRRSMDSAVREALTTDEGTSRSSAAVLDRVDSGSSRELVDKMIDLAAGPYESWSELNTRSQLVATWAEEQPPSWSLSVPVFTELVLGDVGGGIDLDQLRTTLRQPAQEVAATLQRDTPTAERVDALEL